MRTKNTVNQNQRSFRQLLSLFLSLALVLLVIGQRPFGVMNAAASQSMLVTPPVTVPMLNGTLTAVNNTFGSQSNPHVNRNRVSYTNDDFEGRSLIHFFDFSTATDS